MPLTTSGNPWSRPGGLVPRSLTLLKRMDITGARWGTETADAILKLRAIIANGDFDAYWDWHLHREHQRNHPASYTPAT